MLDQEHAVREYLPTDAVVLNSSVLDYRITKNTRFKMRGDWGINLEYQYLHNGVAYTGTTAWYYGNAVGHIYSRAKEVVVGFPIGSTQEVYVNPANPSDSFAVREMWFRPYSAALFICMVNLVVLWYMSAEYDWGKNVPLRRRLYPSTVNSKKFEFCIGTRSLKGGGVAAFIPEMVLLVVWHFVGVAIWTRYMALPNLHNGLGEEVIAYHMIGLALTLRLFYLATMAYNFADIRLSIDTEKVTVDNNIILNVSQDAMRGFSYTTAMMALTCTEGRQRMRNNKTKHVTKALSTTEIDLIKDGYIKGPVSKAQPLNVDVPVCFAKHITSETEPKPNERVMVQWYLSIYLRPAYCPFRYNMHIPVWVHDHPRK